MTLLPIALGIVLGALGALAHLAVVWWRARLVVSERRALALATFPVGLAAPALAVLAAAQVAPLAAWASLAGIVGARAVVLGGRRPTP